MVNEAGYIKVGGSFITKSYNNHEGYLTAGTLEVKGDFIQKVYSSSYPGNFRASGTHKVILSGEKLQKVSFDTPGQSYFNIFEIRNNSKDGVIFENVLAAKKLILNDSNISAISVGAINWELTEDVTIKSDLYITGSVINLNGYKLKVEGNLIQTGGTLYINGGQLYVEGDYKIENN